MKILAIETSCDETAISVIEASGTIDAAQFSVRGNALYSQAQKHAAYGGVYPSLAKREHATNLVPLLTTALRDAGIYFPHHTTLPEDTATHLHTLLQREEGLYDSLVRTLSSIERPPLDAIAVTYGPGLEPALWVGINFARALGYVWDIPLIPVHHLEGHIVASTVVADQNHPTLYTMTPVSFPTLSLVISGGHTEFIYAPSWGTYTVVGGTRDDSVGEAFDKVARLLDIPYPGGAGLSTLAHKYRITHATKPVTPNLVKKTLPRPMMHTNDLDLSFSGLKTAVLYWVRDIGTLTDPMRQYIAAEFEDAVTDVLLTKISKAVHIHKPQTFLLGGGVSANTYLRTRLFQHFSHEGIEVPVRVPAEGLSTDNAIMIGMAGYLIHLRDVPFLNPQDELRAQGNARIDEQPSFR